MTHKSHCSITRLWYSEMLLPGAIALLLVINLSACSGQSNQRAIDSIAPTAQELFEKDLGQARTASSGESISVDGSRSAGLSALYYFELVRDGKAPVRCNNRVGFLNGDSVRFHFKVSSPGYAYLSVVDSDGNKQSIFPADGVEPERLEADKDYAVPPEGMFKFDEKTGTERLLFVVSKEPVDENANEQTGTVIKSSDLTAALATVGGYSITANEHSGDGSVYVRSSSDQAR